MKSSELGLQAVLSWPRRNTTVWSFIKVTFSLANSKNGFRSARYNIFIFLKVSPWAWFVFLFVIEPKRQRNYFPSSKRLLFNRIFRRGRVLIDCFFIQKWLFQFIFVFEPNYHFFLCFRLLGIVSARSRLSLSKILRYKFFGYRRSLISLLIPCLKKWKFLFFA